MRVQSIRKVTPSDTPFARISQCRTFSGGTVLAQHQGPGLISPASGPNLCSQSAGRETPSFRGRYALVRGVLGQSHDLALRAADASGEARYSDQVLEHLDERLRKLILAIEHASKGREKCGLARRRATGPPLDELVKPRTEQPGREARGFEVDHGEREPIDGDTARAASSPSHR
jgi:hypothetical protein